METERKWRTLWTLFASMLSISACTFGGGFVIVTFMRRRFVEELHWLAEDEMLDLIALAQSSPGAIAVNAAILVGWRIGGFLGMLAAVLGTILPPMLILDEATSSIDVQTEKALQTGLNAMLQGRTSFIIAHRLSTIRKADRIAFIKDGRVAEIGSYEELMAKKGYFYALYTVSQ